MVGFSRGGLQGLLTFNDLPVDSYMIWGGVSDIHLMYEERVDLRGMLRRMVGHPKKIRKHKEQRCNAIYKKIVLLFSLFMVAKIFKLEYTKLMI